METQTKLSAKKIMKIAQDVSWLNVPQTDPSDLRPVNISFEEFEMICAAREVAILQAVQNTWLKNINPECVPELLETLKSTRSKLMDKFGLFGGGMEINEIFNGLNEAISKATINQ